MYYLVLFSFCLCCQYRCNWLPGKTRPEMTASLLLRSMTSGSTLMPTCLWGPSLLLLSDRVLWLFIRSGVCGILFHVILCWPWFVPHCQQGWLLQLCSCWCFLPSAVHFEFCCSLGLLSMAVRTHNSITPIAPLVKSSIADEISAVHTGLLLSSWHSAILPRWEPSSQWHPTLTLATAWILLTHPHWSYYPLNTQRSVIGSSQWLRHVHGTAFHLPSEMHHRWCRSTAAWRLFCSDRPLVTSPATVSVFMFCNFRTLPTAPVMFLHDSVSTLIMIITSTY